jgi:hypothetical protein
VAFFAALLEGRETEIKDLTKNFDNGVAERHLFYRWTQYGMVTQRFSKTLGSPELLRRYVVVMKSMTPKFIAHFCHTLRRSNRRSIQARMALSEVIRNA